MADKEQIEMYDRQSRSFRRVTAGACAIGTALLAISGCGHRDANAPTQVSMTLRIQQIKNNPHMPDVAKQMAISQIQAHAAQIAH